jgi:hypothetical protein
VEPESIKDGHFRSKNPRKPYGIIFRIKPDVHSESEEYQRISPHNKWDIHKWYKTTKDRDKALDVLMASRSIYEYRMNGMASATDA